MNQLHETFAGGAASHVRLWAATFLFVPLQKLVECRERDNFDVFFSKNWTWSFQAEGLCFLSRKRHFPQRFSGGLEALR